MTEEVKKRSGESLAVVAKGLLARALALLSLKHRASELKTEELCARVDEQSHTVALSGSLCLLTLADVEDLTAAFAHCTGVRVDLRPSGASEWRFEYDPEDRASTTQGESASAELAAHAVWFAPLTQFAQLLELRTDLPAADVARLSDVSCRAYRVLPRGARVSMVETSAESYTLECTGLMTVFLNQLRALVRNSLADVVSNVQVDLSRRCVRVHVRSTTAPSPTHIWVNAGLHLEAKVESSATGKGSLGAKRPRL